MRAALVVALLGALAAPAAASPVASDETVVVFPTLAASDGRAWLVPVNVWVGELEPRSFWRRHFVKGVRTLVRPRDAAEERALDTRVRWLLADDESRKDVTVRVGGVTTTLPATSADGHARALVRVPIEAATSTTLTIEALVPDGRVFTGTAALAEPEGVLVITDVDDTLRVSDVRDVPRLVRRTLVEPWEPVPGVASLLAAFAARGASFAYVSAMPTQLAEELTAFLTAAGAPPGALALRQMTDRDRRTLRFPVPPRRHKVPAIEDLARRFPHRRLVLLGDSGEYDPEIYGAIARLLPAGRVAAILIRELPDAPLDAARRARAFDPQMPVHVFADPAQLPAAIRAGSI